MIASRSARTNSVRAFLGEVMSYLKQSSDKQYNTRIETPDQASACIADLVQQHGTAVLIPAIEAMSRTDLNAVNEIGFAAAVKFGSGTNEDQLPVCDRPVYAD